LRKKEVANNEKMLKRRKNERLKNWEKAEKRFEQLLNETPLYKKKEEEFLKMQDEELSTRLAAVDEVKLKITRQEIA
jgi:hypothetical protein